LLRYRIAGFHQSLPACAQTISHLQNTRREVGSPPTVFPASAPATLESRLMPMDRIERPIPLEDPLAAPRSAIPDFNSVVVRDDGVPQQYPTLPVMTLKNVTLGQFPQFVQASFPSAQILRVKIERVQTDTTIADRLSVTPSPAWQSVSDDEMLRTLAAAGPRRPKEPANRPTKP
jgi:hypothetical protein